jgi:hypothetical protein
MPLSSAAFPPCTVVVQESTSTHLNRTHHPPGASSESLNRRAHDRSAASHHPGGRGTSAVRATFSSPEPPCVLKSKGISLQVEHRLQHARPGGLRCARAAISNRPPHCSQVRRHLGALLWSSQDKNDGSQTIGTSEQNLGGRTRLSRWRQVPGRCRQPVAATRASRDFRRPFTHH